MFRLSAFASTAHRSCGFCSMRCRKFSLHKHFRAFDAVFTQSTKDNCVGCLKRKFFAHLICSGFGQKKKKIILRANLSNVAQNSIRVEVKRWSINYKQSRQQIEFLDFIPFSLSGFIGCEIEKFKLNPSIVCLSGKWSASDGKIGKFLIQSVLCIQKYFLFCVTNIDSYAF